jgi:RHS Repeat
LFGYDGNDNLTSVTDPDGSTHVTTYTYDTWVPEMSDSGAPALAGSTRDRL